MTNDRGTTTEGNAGTAHPLDPLSAEEIATAVRIARASQSLSEHARFCGVTLDEPTRAETRSGQVGRRVRLIVLEPQNAMTYDGIVCLRTESVLEWAEVPGAQPMFTTEELITADEVVRSDPRWIDAVRSRGLDPADCMADLHSVGNTPAADQRHRRLASARTWVTGGPDGNPYARGVDGIRMLVDVNTFEIVEFEDHGHVPVAPGDARFDFDSVTVNRPPLKPLDVVQPDGPSFTLNGYGLQWQNWSLHVGFSAREGLVLHDITYTDAGRKRPVLRRAGLSDLIVPYGDPRPGYFHYGPFDIGEFAFGNLTNPLTLGCDCLGEIRYLDVAVANGHGDPAIVQNAVCIHEEDYGVLWKHVDPFSGKSEVRRSRRLVLSSFYTAGNYDYGLFWYFYQDGSIQFEAKLTGLVYTGGVPESGPPPWGTIVADGVYAPVHQHFFAMRLDFDLDGGPSSVVEVDTITDPEGPENSYLNAFRPVLRYFETEDEVARDTNAAAGRYWMVVNEESTNSLGNPVGYRLVPGEAAKPLSGVGSDFDKRAGFLRHNLYATAYAPEQRYASGEYPNQASAADGLLAYQEAGRSVRKADVVTWYTFGHHHVPRPEDWPVMPVHHMGFSLKPSGFFEHNPALDVAPPAHGCHD